MATKTSPTLRTRVFDLALTLIVACATMSVLALPAHAGCGCQKAPPELASVRPNATYAGAKVTLFSPSFVVGSSYTVEFASGTSTTKASVTTTAVSRRDLADAAYKRQLVVTLPAGLPLGPTRVTARLSNQTTLLLNLADDAFTVVPPPIVVPEDVGGTSYPSYKAAVGRDRTVYLTLDMTGVTQPRVFRAQAQGYPLTFGSDDVVFYNTQGFLMQLLSANMPGLYTVLPSNGPSNSNILGYSRHEFNTFYLQHSERQAHQVIDGDWHGDGTRHVDHDHLVLAIAGTLANGALPVPGATPAFTLVLERNSLFHHGLVGTATGTTAVSMTNSARTDSYDSRTGVFGQEGDVRGNGPITLSGSAVLDGSATAPAITVTNPATITGAQVIATQPEAFMSVKVPDLLSDLGAITLTNYQTQTLNPGSYKAARVSLIGHATLYINNCAGPVTLYVTGTGVPGTVEVLQQATITTCASDPEKFAVYQASNATVTLQGGGTFNGVVYAPQSLLSIANSGEFFGSFVAGTVQLGNASRVHYDTALKGPAALLNGQSMYLMGMDALMMDGGDTGVEPPSDWVPTL